VITVRVSEVKLQLQLFFFISQNFTVEITVKSIFILQLSCS
jgi:hypothetical protein